MGKQVTSMEAKLDSLQDFKDFSAIDDTLGHLVTRMDLVIKSVDEKIDDQGLRLDSIKRAMERLRESNNREDEAVREVNRKLERFEIMLRRILGFNKAFEKLAEKLTDVDDKVYDLHGLGFPRHGNESSPEDDDSDETHTQYDNEKLEPESIPSFSPTNVPVLVPVTDPSDSAPSDSVPSDSVPSDSVPSDSVPGVSTAEPVVASAVVASAVEAPAAVISVSPDITMTSPTPLNSQDNDQTTTVITASTDLLSPPANVPTSSDHLSPPSTTNAGIPKAKGRTNTVGRRRSPRGLNSRDPTPVNDLGPKRRSEDGEDGEGNDRKRRKAVPS